MVVGEKCHIMVPEGLACNAYMSVCMDHLTMPYDNSHSSWTLKNEVLAMILIETWKTYTVADWK